MSSIRLTGCKLPPAHRSPRELFGKIASSITCALRVTSVVISLSQDLRKCSNPGEGFGRSGHITVLSHFAVVIAVLTGVAVNLMAPLIVFVLAAGDL
ncbi:hypothetical protein BRARA_E02961 [Brassica rapa]|uniref:Uncharacterized protein n=1 Tax=Brassica campestris TaxID=3711 RepID=A0A397ZES9_BRACM|nr:hypothetical protein BRARA_E02961 [Brassica rapa]